VADKKLERLKNMDKVVENADMKTQVAKEQTDQKPQQVRKQLNMPKDWSDAIKANYAGTATSYILTAIKKQLEQDQYI
jgi:hypothetical protein